MLSEASIFYRRTVVNREISRHVLGIPGKCEKMLALAVLGCGLFALPFTVLSEAPGASDLTTKEVALFLQTYDRYSELLTANIIERSANDREQGAKKTEFLAVMALVPQEIDKAEKTACKESGMHHGRYRLLLQRVLAVQEYEGFLEIQVHVEEEISKREKMDDAEHKAAAEKSYRDLEEWFAPFEENVVTARQESEKKKRQYLEEIESQNNKIDEYNRALPPNPLLVKMTERKAADEKRLNDPRFAEVHDQIKLDIVELEAVLARLEKKEQRRKKRLKKPSASILRKFERAVTTAVQQRDSYEEIVMKPARENKASGQWLELSKANDAKKTKEHRQAISKVESMLKQPRLKQAAKDSTVVLKVIDREKLKSISPSF